MFCSIKFDIFSFLTYLIKKYHIITIKNAGTYYIAYLW